MSSTLIIVLIYLVVVTAIIMWSGKKVKTYKDFALGGASIPWLVIAGTMFASTVGGATMIGYVGNYKQYGLQWATLPFVAFCTSSILIGLFLAPRLKNLNQYTTADMLKIRYGRTARIIAALLNCLGEMAVVAAMMASFGTMVNGYLGVDYNIAMVAAVIIFYFTATMGGLKGVAWTDMIQAIVIFITVAVIAILSAGTIKSNGGLSALPANLLNPFAANMPWKTMAGNIVSGAFMGTVMQSLLVQRINACKNPLDAKKATVLNGIACGVFMIVGIGTIGLAANFTTGPDVTGNNVITAVLSGMPALLGAFYAAAILAAVLTTANSLLLSCSMTFVRDLLGEFQTMNDKQELRASKLFIIAVDVLAFVVVRYSSSVIGWIMITYTVLACLCVPLYGGLFFKKSTPASGVLSLAMGGGAAILWEILSKFGVLPAGVAAIHSVFPGVLFGLIGLVIGFSSKVPSSAEQLRVVDCFKANQPYFPSAEAAGAEQCQPEASMKGKPVMQAEAE